MSFFRRIGTVRHKYKVEFFIKRVTFNKVLGGTVYVSLHRGDHKTKSEEVPFNEKTCQFNNQVLTVPTTLFYDEGEHLYQEKPGELRVILKTSNEDKKLLGVVPIDIAAYANQTGTKTFKEKKELEQTPTHLKAHITFQVYIEHIGEGSENSKSLVKDEKTPREESPLNKITSFLGTFVGSAEQHENQSSKNQTPKQNPTKRDLSTKKAPSPSKKLNFRLDQPEQQKLNIIKQVQAPTSIADQEEQAQEEALFSRRKPKEKRKKQKEKEKELKNKSVEEGPERQQDKQQVLFSGKREKQKPSAEKERKISIEESDQHQSQTNDFYFDDPLSFPKKNKRKPQQAGDDKNEAQFAELDRPQPQSAKTEETPKRRKKVKQTSINLAPKTMHEASDKDYQKNRIIDNRPTREIVSEKKQKQEKQSQELTRLLQERKVLQKNQQQIQQQNMEKLKQIAVLKKELASKDKIIADLKTPAASLQELSAQAIHADKSLKLFQQSINILEAAKNNLEKEVTALQAQQKNYKGQIDKLKVQNEKLKTENDKLKTEGAKNESFFRQTEERFQPANKESDLEEEVKRLQREKNEYMLALQKEKQKSKKQAKRLSQEAEKEALNFKQYQEFSKAELKKMKDEALAKAAEAEGWRDKAKEKAKQLDTLLRENKALNGSNIELKEKLASLKIKICEKLNEANERGAFDLMEVLTDLNQEF